MMMEPDGVKVTSAELDETTDLAVRFRGYISGKPVTIPRAKVTHWEAHNDDCTEIFLEGGDSKTVFASDLRVAEALDFEVRNIP